MKTRLAEAIIATFASRARNALSGRRIPSAWPRFVQTPQIGPGKRRVRFSIAQGKRAELVSGALTGCLGSLRTTRCVSKAARAL